MSNQSYSKHMIDPYRTIGNFISGKLSLSLSSPPSLTAPTNTSFKIYSHSLAIKVASPCFPHKITAALSYNEYTYLRTKGEVIKMKYHHIVGKWMIEGGEDRCSLLRFQDLIVICQGNMVAIIDETSNEIIYRKYGQKTLGMVHPVTYVNKLILYSSTKFMLINIIADKMLYQYPRLIQFLNDNNRTIAIVEATPLPDVISIGLDNGVIAFLNLKKDEIIFTVKQKLPASAIGFSSEQSWMASSDQQGNVLLWDLENKRILYKFEKCIDGQIDSLIFMPGYPILTCGSSSSNCIKQLRINLEDNKILTTYRQRIGNLHPIEQIKIASNNQLVISTQNQSMFVSFHSQCNNYLLPRTLDSKLPYHLITRHFNVELYKERTVEKVFKLHQYAIVGKISLSNKYYIVATKKRMVKLGGSYQVQWNIPNVKHILLFNEHFIYAFTHNEMIVCDFNTNTIVKRIEITVERPTTNLYNNLLAFFNPSQNQIEIWDMSKIVQGRIFKLTGQQTLCLSFTAQNRFLLSTHPQGKIFIWNIIDNQLYKEFNVEGQQNIIWHCFTPDNQFMISAFEGKKQANVWNNYIGKISSIRSKQHIAFAPQIRYFQQDYRKQLLKGYQQQQLQFSHSADDVLDQIPDADDGVEEYNFNDITKWMPLVFYDQIKARNAPNSKGEVPSMPFFLDFRNLTEQKKKIEEEIKKDAIQKKKAYIQQKDKHLKDQSNQILLNQQSTQTDYLKTFSNLCQLSIAQIDYQLRSYLLNPINKPYLILMMIAVYKDHSHQLRQQLKNIILNRIINIIGIDILSSQLAQPCAELFQTIAKPITEMKEKVDRCVIIADKNLN